MVNRQKEHLGAPIEDQDTNVRQKIFDDIQRLSQRHRLPPGTEASKGQASGSRSC